MTKARVAKQAPTLCLGADIKNRFLFVEGERWRFGPDYHDLALAENYQGFRSRVFRLCRGLKAKPVVIACDRHPGYLSTHLAKEVAASLPGHRMIFVQHHHAHIASVMNEHALKRPVIGVSFDGTGFGTDGHIWGGEFLLVERGTFRRLAHLRYFQMPGGDRVVREPWRMVLSILGQRARGRLRKVGRKQQDIVLSMMARDFNSPLTSSAGRLFDAAAALLGLGETAAYEAQGPVRLEALCEPTCEAGYDFKVDRTDGLLVVDTQPVFRQMLKDVKDGKTKAFIATRFHNTMADMIIVTVKRLSRATGIRDVALSGGVFQNRFLREAVTARLSRSPYHVFFNERTPVNDFNISLGQYDVSRRSGKG